MCWVEGRQDGYGLLLAAVGVDFIDPFKIIAPYNIYRTVKNLPTVTSIGGAMESPLTGAGKWQMRYSEVTKKGPSNRPFF
jgi:hypothetical protein